MASWFIHDTIDSRGTAQVWTAMACPGVEHMTLGVNNKLYGGCHEMEQICVPDFYVYETQIHVSMISSNLICQIKTK